MRLFSGFSYSELDAMIDILRVGLVPLLQIVVFMKHHFTSHYGYLAFDIVSLNLPLALLYLYF